MNYISVLVSVEPVQPGSDILMALWAEDGFESFIPTKNGFEAFIQKENFNEELIVPNEDFDFKYSYSVSEIEHENWNKTWEKNFQPVKVNEDCVIRADFHESFNVKYELIITPRMSFGTGHHETTRMMCNALLQESVKSKRVLDMGCGTGVLGILAEKAGADFSLGIEIEDWSTENANENAIRNNCKIFHAICGDASLIPNEKFDLVLANINKNVLMQDVQLYSLSMNIGAVLLLSGFFETDSKQIIDACETFGLKFSKQFTENQWACLRFTKVNVAQ